MDRDLSAGTLSPDGSLPGSRIAPNPILLTVRLGDEFRDTA